MRNSVRYEHFHSLQQDILNFSDSLGIFTVKSQVILPYFISYFTYGLLNDNVSNSGNIASNESMTSNNKLEKMWKESIMVQFKVLTRHSPRGTEEYHEEPSKDNRCSS
jgi:hypothetical protein